VKNNIEAALWGAFYADAYSLGTHWIYDTQQIADAQLDPNQFHDPMSSYHPNKSAGDFTHYGDQMLWLLAEVAEEKEFEIERFAARWQKEMSQYQGYIDGASKHTLSMLKAGERVDSCGSSSRDFSVVGRALPLVFALNNNQLSDNLASHTNLTHRNTDLVESTKYFLQLIGAVNEGADIKQTIVEITPAYSGNIQSWVENGLSEVGQEPEKAITTLGPACPVDGSFASAIYLVTSFDDFQEAMEANVKGGGDSAARGLVVGAVLGARGGMSVMPENISQMTKRDEIKKFMRTIGERTS